MSSFAAIDFETANEELSSPCAVGWAVVEDGRIEKGATLIRPPSFRFRDFNIGIHGIRSTDCERAPTWPEVLNHLAAIVGDRIVVAHNARFDSGVVRESCDATSLPWPSWSFVCSMEIGRGAWPHLPSYTLVNVAEAAGLPRFDHHRADDDAMAAAGIALSAMQMLRLMTLEALVDALAIQPSGIRPGGHTIGGRWAPSAHVPRTVSPDVVIHSDHPFFGKKVAFTGDLHSMSRGEAQQAVLDVGGRGMTTVSKLTDFVVVGGEFHGLTDGHESLKMEKVKGLKAQGCPIEMVNEHDFLSLLRGH